jgi:hypothetical protein
MGDINELTLLREKYEQALASYEAVCSALNRHLRAATDPSPEQLQRELNGRAALQTARDAYLDALMSDRGTP